MNYKHTILMAAVALMAAVGCNKVQNDPVTGDGGDYRTNNLSFTISREGADTDDGEKGFLEWNTGLQGVKWVKQDTLIVFDDTGKGVKFTTTASGTPTATFTTTSWTGNVPTYAACYAHEFGEEYSLTMPEEGKIRVNQRRNQNLVQWKGCSSNLASCLVGKAIEDTPKYKMGEMKNVNGFIKVNIGSLSVNKITVTAIGGEPIAGWVDVDYAKLTGGQEDFYTEVKVTNMVHIEPCEGGNTLVDGNFANGSYIIAVLPGIYEQGLQFDLYDKDGGILFTRTIGGEGGVTIHRNEVITVKKNLDVEMPSGDLILDINFDNEDGINPLGTFKEADKQATTGETYQFIAPLPSSEFSAQFPIVISKGSLLASGTAYEYAYLKPGEFTYSNYVLHFTKREGWLKIPAIPGKTFQSATIYSALRYNTGRLLRVRTSASSNAYAQKSAVAASSTGPRSFAINFYQDGNDGLSGQAANVTKENTPYWLAFCSSNNPPVDDHDMRITRLIIKYVDVLPTR